MVNVTLFELHLEESQFTANAPNSGVTEDAGSDDDVEVTTDEESSAVPVAALAVLAVVVAIASALAAKKMLGEGEESDD